MLPHPIQKECDLNMNGYKILVEWNSEEMNIKAKNKEEALEIARNTANSFPSMSNVEVLETTKDINNNEIENYERFGVEMIQYENRISNIV